MGDHVDLLALSDVLAVADICGSGNMSLAHGFEYKPIRLQVFESSSDTAALAEEHLKNNTGLKTQRRPADFHVSEIRTERELRPTGYEPQFVNFPITLREITVELPSEDYLGIQHLRGAIGKTDEEVIRTAFLIWYTLNRKATGMRWRRQPGQI